MPIDERSISLPEQWAKDAQTVIPAPPVPGIAYRNTAITPEQWAHGQDYSRAADSAQWNQMFWTMSGLLKFAEQYGVMPYSPFTDYPESGICMGLDGILYQAVQPSGPNNGGAQPITNGSYWLNYVTKFSAAPATTTSRGIGRVATAAEALPGSTILNGPAFLDAGTFKVTPTPTANAVPQANANGKLDGGWLSLDLPGYLQPSMTGSATLNGNTNNTVQLIGIVPTLGLEVGDVIRIQYSDYDKLHSVESIVYNNLIVVNYEHAGNRGNGSLKLPNTTATATITRIAKWYNAPLGLGQAWVGMMGDRGASVTYTNTTGRTITILIRADLNSFSLVIGGATFSGLDGTAYTNMSFPVPAGQTYLVTVGGSISFQAWGELR